MRASATLQIAASESATLRVRCPFRSRELQLLALRLEARGRVRLVDQDLLLRCFRRIERLAPVLGEQRLGRIVERSPGIARLDDDLPLAAVGVVDDDLL